MENTNNGDERRISSNLLNSDTSTNCYQSYYPYDWYYPYYVEPFYPYVPYKPIYVYPQPSITFNTFEVNYCLKPDVYVSVNKQRKKLFGEKIYLQNGDEFEFEIFNKDTQTIGILFKLDGKYMSTRHLVVKPGQRIFWTGT